MEVIRDDDENRFEVRADNAIAFLQYRTAKGLITFVHTEVPSALEGQGIGGRLAKAGLEFAREAGIRVVPQCPFVASYIRRHPEYVELVDPTHRSSVGGKA